MTPKTVPDLRKSSDRAVGVPATQAGTTCVAGVVGMGLMGTSISVCLLAAGHRLCCVDSDPAKLRTARTRLFKLLKDAQRQGIVTVPPAVLIQRAKFFIEFSGLKTAEIVIESTVEDLEVKRRVIGEIDAAVSVRTIIGSNTSAIPVTDLQSYARRPGRVIGLHWAEPAHITRFMEIVCGRQTTAATAQRVVHLARMWGKEPSLLRQDIRGFIANRIMYAMLREAFHLVDSGFASVADVDRSLRNDMGYWITFAGPFRFMDLTGIPAYAAVMKDLLPDLSCATTVPRLMKKVVRSGACGVSNAKGFYRYTPAQAKRWNKLFMEFSYQIRELADKHPEDAGDTKKSTRTTNR